MAPLTIEQRSSVMSLALAYDAFKEAREEGRANGVFVWGRILLEAQEETGVVLIDAPDVAAVIHQFGKAQFGKS